MKQQNQSDLLLANIETLKAKQVLELEILKAQLHITYQSMHPINLIKKFFGDISTLKPNGSFFEKIIGILSNFIANKMVVSTSKNLVRKSISSVLQLSAAKSLANHTEIINKAIAWIFQRLMRKKES